MAASSSSSGAAGGVFAVWLHDANGNRVALVDLPVPLPLIVVYQGNYYAWSQYVFMRYVQFTPYAATPDLGAPALSVVADPYNRFEY